jgi:hypothetical protein
MCTVKSVHLFFVIAGPPRSGATRQSIFFAKKMDARVKPAHDSGAIVRFR